MRDKLYIFKYKNQTGIKHISFCHTQLSNNTNNDFISLTDIARYRSQSEPFSVINNWMRGKFTLAYLGLWETMNNVDFKPLEFERFKNEAGYNYFVLSPQQWIEKTNAKGIIPKSGRYGGTFAHIDPFDVLIILQRMLTVVIAPALIITKLLVSPSNNLLTTGQTFRNN